MQKNGELEVVVVSSMPRKLRERIDRLAKLEKRSRARQIVVLLEEIMAAKMAASQAFR